MAEEKKKAAPAASPTEQKGPAEDQKPKGEQKPEGEQKPAATKPEEGAIPTSYQASSVFSSWSSLPFASLIGDPLRAAVAAQADANKQVLKYMQDVAFGAKAEGKDGEPAKAVKFDFEFLNNGKLSKLSVPLITLVPINFLTIDKVRVQFKAAINATNNSSSVNQTIENEINATKKKVDEKKAAEKKAEAGEGGNGGGGNNGNESGGSGEESTWDKIKSGVQKLMPTISKIAGGESEKSSAPQGDNTSYSSKKDSKSTRDSKYSVETTIDFEVTAVPSDMPSGLSKMLEVLNGAINVINPAGELFITEKEAPKGSKIYITYKTGEGVFAPADIKIEPEESVTKATTGDGVLATFDKAGNYTVTAGKQTGSIEIKE